MARKFSIRGLLSLKDEASPVAKKAQSRLSKLSGAMKVGLVAGAAAATAAVVGLVKIMKSSVSAAQVQEDAIVKLDASLASLGPQAKEVSAALQEQAAALQKQTRFGDEAIIEAQSLIAAFVKEEGAIKAATKATLDLAAGKGIDLRVAADLVSKSLGSSTNALSRYGIEVVGAVGSTERLDALTKGIAKTFGGQAAEQAKSFSGIISQLSNAFGDLQEKIGEAITKSDTIRGALTRLKEILASPEATVAAENLGKALVQLGSSALGLTKAIIPATKVLIAWSNVLAVTREFTAKTAAAILKVQLAFDKHNREAQAARLAHLETAASSLKLQINLKTLNESLDDIVSSFSGAAGGLDELGQSAGSATPPLKTLGETSNELSELLKNLGITTDQELNAALQKNQEQVETLQAAYDAELITVEQLDEGLAALALKAEELTGKLEEQETQVGNTAEQFDGLTESVGTGADAYRQNRQAADELNNSLNRLRSTIRFTSGDFDELRRASGNAVAVASSLAGGGTLSQGGRVINLPGGGSRLVNISSQFAANSGRFNIDGTPRKIG